MDGCAPSITLSPCFDHEIYCRVPARRGLQQTARAATRHGARDPLVRPHI